MTAERLELIRTAGERSVPSLDELRAGPPIVDVATASAVLGVSRSYGYQLVKGGEFPVRVIKVGSQWRVPTAALIAVLEGDEPLRANA